MQPNNDKVSLDAVKLLRTTGENNSDKTMDGPRLRPILFVSRKYTTTEFHYHSFVGEVATGRWAISETRAYFWGTHFYWLCNMKTVYKILNYEGSIYSISRLAHELLAYSFTCVHRSNSMMVDVDVLSRYYDPLAVKHVAIANTYHISNGHNCVDAYSSIVFDDLLLHNKYTLKPSAKRKFVDCN